jgi:hypothetical protein
MPKRGGRSKRRPMGDMQARHDTSGRQEAQTARTRISAPDSRHASQAFETRAARIRFRFVHGGAILPRDQLWTTLALPVDGLAVALRRFRKSHHLIRAGHDPPPIH